MKMTALAALAALAIALAAPALAAEGQGFAHGETAAAGHDGARKPRLDLGSGGDDAAPRADNGVFDGRIARLDWPPLLGGFLFSTGVVIGDIRVAALASAMAGDGGLGPQHAPIEQGRKLAPYVGIGYRSPGAGLGFYGNAGMVAASAVGEARYMPEQDVYPVLELGVSYRF